MPINYTQLATEINTDPAALGYAPHVASGDDGAIAVILNGTQGGAVIDVSELPAQKLQEAVVAGDYTALAVAARDLWAAIINASPVPIKSAGYRAQIGTIWGAGTTTRANLLALQTKQGTRSETLFGEGVVVTPADVAKALRG